MPRPDSRLIPLGWAEHHQRPVMDTMTATGLITRAGIGPAVFDPTTGLTTAPDRDVIYDGPVRVQDQLLRRGSLVEFGGQQVTVGRIRVSLPSDVPVLEDDQIAITDTLSPNLAGQVLRVMERELSSIAWQQELTCEINLG